MPRDSILDMVNNIEPMYSAKVAMFDSWVEQGDAWSEREARMEAYSLAQKFAEELEAESLVGRGFIDPEDRYGDHEIRAAATDMMREFEDYREEAIKYIVAQESHVPTPEEMGMDAGDIEHAKKYEDVAQKIGIEELRALIPASSEKIRKALEKGDKYLNTIPLRKWDAAAGSIRVPGFSLSEKVSALKHVAKWHYA